MRIVHILVPVAIAISALGQPALAQVKPAELRIADDEVARQTENLRQAVQQGDPATIAVARAKLQAARAVAWGKRNPPKPPIKQVSAN